MDTGSGENQTGIESSLMDELHRAFEFCQAIDTALENCDLESVFRLDQQRQQCIQHYFQHAQDPDKESIARLRDENDVIIRKLVGLQRRIRNQQIDLGNANKAARAYQRNQS